MRRRAEAGRGTTCLAGGLCLAVLGGCATTVPPTPVQHPATAQAIDNTRSTVRATALWLARGVDSWFGDRPFDEAGSVTNGRLSVSVLHREDESLDADVRFNARFRLPNIEDWGYLFVGRDNPREVITDQPAAFTARERLTPQSTQDRSFFAGFGRELGDAIDFRLGFRGGLKPYAQARYRHAWQTGPEDLVEFRQTVFWSSDDRLGTTAALSVEHAFSPVLVGRWLSAATVTQVSDGLEWQTRLGAHRSYGRQRLLSVEGLMSAQRRTGVDVGDYGLQLRWEQPVHRDWLLGEVLIGHFWPRPTPDVTRGRAWAVGVGLKLKF